jgi:hypothetical protein
MCKSENADHRAFGFNQRGVTLLHGYFYYQSSVWRLGANGALETSYNAVKSLKRKIINELNVTDYDIINYVHSLPERYENIRLKCTYGSCKFVELQSFRDFIINL